ncbi:hypothetical protein DY000_02025525 [Brassica cretica]|uniref:Uncharacterized protein n=1 Tax=Brassica cretica TaxID=69181 RepID=A0ABQ7E5W1_BRACR|nr:hypothetical protein DY000_02025525 [Brassica cretica]
MMILEKEENEERDMERKDDRRYLLENGNIYERRIELPINDGFHSCHDCPSLERPDATCSENSYRSLQSNDALKERSLEANVAVEVPLIPLVNQVGQMVLNDMHNSIQAAKNGHQRSNTYCQLNHTSVSHYSFS